MPTPRKSTHDLAGKGKFALFVGIDGDAWTAAAKIVSEELAVAIGTFRIGQGQEYTDMYQDWERLCEIEEDGCLLIRPDRIVAWRSKSAISEPASSLLSVLKTILSR